MEYSHQYGRHKREREKGQNEEMIKKFLPYPFAPVTLPGYVNSLCTSL